MYADDLKTMVSSNLTHGLAYLQLKPMKASLANIVNEKLAGTTIGGSLKGGFAFNPGKP